MVHEEGDNRVPILEPAESGSPKTFYYAEGEFPANGAGVLQQHQQLPVSTADAQAMDPTSLLLPNRLAYLRANYRWYRALHALRWRLAPGVFAKPLPFLTASLDIKLGDVLVTLPVAGGLLAWCAAELAQLHTKNNGAPAQVAMGLAFVLSVRNNSLLLALTGLSFERAILYHKLFGALAFVTSTMHGLSYLLKHHQVYGPAGVTRAFTQDDLDDSSSSAAVSGAVAYFPLVALFLFSFYVLRRRFFDLFLRLHWVFFTAIIVGSLLHGITLAVVGAGVWGVDAVYRLVYLPQVYKHGGRRLKQSLAVRRGADTAGEDGSMGTATTKRGRQMGVAALSQVTATKIPGGIVRIQFPAVRADTGERFQYEPGQFAFLCVPQLSVLQWHPFSISSAPHEPVVTFHIRVLGDWTAKLLELVESSAGGNSEAGGAVPLDVSIDGSYGQVAVDIDNPAAYSHVVLFSGGIGVTPMKSIVNQLHFDYTTRGRQELQRVHFVWSVRDRAMLSALLESPFPTATASTPAVPTSYFPHELRQQRVESTAATATESPVFSTKSPVFSTEIYMTRGERDLEHPDSAGGAHPGASMRYGARPDVREILRTIGEDAKLRGRGRVAVLACGPSTLTRDVVATSLQLSREMNVRFDVHTEKFEF
ncbi:hypothetical protein PybrP1_004100 [[Pythium] brassicae (nom. inval.)]|nr:hypothetical protein PybrP1_004100 [[Pythium] brassicae (nom. inval.)]